MAWTFTEPFIIDQAVDELSTTKKFDLGTIVRAREPTYGAGEFIYLAGVASAVAGSIVEYDNSFTAALHTTTLDDPAPVAVFAAACTASYYGWAQISGVAYVSKSNSLCLLKGAEIAGSAGAAIAVASGLILNAAVVAIHASVVSPAEAFVYVMINRAHGPSDVS
jgi:hypothetical protein